VIPSVAVSSGAACEVRSSARSAFLVVLVRDALGGQLRWNSSWLGVFALIHPLGWLRLEAEF
jgi:hypothetical protein